MLGDAERPADHRLVGARVGVRGFANHVRGNAGRALAELERVRLDRRRDTRRIPSCAFAMNAIVREPGVDDLARHRVGERDVAADVEAHPHVGPLGGRGPPRIDHVEPRAVPDPLQQMVEPDRVRLARVRSPEEDDVRLLDFAVGARASTRSEHRRQTDDARRVSGPVATVDVVGAERDAGELLRQEVHLVGGLRAAEDPERVRAARVDVAAEALGRAVERLVPACRDAARRCRGRAAA